MNRLFLLLTVLCLLAALGPALVSLATAVVPLIAIGGAVVVVVRLVWFYTNRY